MAQRLALDETFPAGRPGVAARLYELVNWAEGDGVFGLDDHEIHTYQVTGGSDATENRYLLTVQPPQGPQLCYGTLPETELADWAMLRLLHSILNRAINRAMARDKVKREVVARCDVPTGRGGRPSKSLTFDQAQAVLVDPPQRPGRRSGQPVLVQQALPRPARHRPTAARGTASSRRGSPAVLTRCTWPPVFGIGPRTGLRYATAARNTLATDEPTAPPAGGERLIP